MVAVITTDTVPDVLASVSPSQFVWAGHEVEIGLPLHALAPAWQVLEAAGTATGFQGFRFVEVWVATAAAEAGETPLFVLGRRAGLPSFVLPMALVTHAGVTVLQWLAQSHASYGMGLFDAAVLAELEPGDVDELVYEVARRVGAAVIHLDRQPARWLGHANPFAASPCAMVTANDTYVLPLEKDYKAQYKRLYPGRSLQPLRRRQRRLEEMGKLSYAPPAGESERNAALAWFRLYKREQIEKAGGTSPFDPPGIRSLYERLARDPEHFTIEQAVVGEERAALGMTLLSGGIAYGVNTAHDDRFSRGSPGTLLQHRIVEECHARGARAYDFGPGFLPYKLDWQPEVIPLLATTHLVRPVGLHAQAALVFGVLARAKIKRNAKLAEWARRVRRWLP